MKAYTYILLAFVLILSSCANEWTAEEMDANCLEAWELVKKEVLHGNLEHTDVWTTSKMLPANTKLEQMNENYITSPDYATYAFYINPQTDIDGFGVCYLVFCSKDGKITTHQLNGFSERIKGNDCFNISLYSFTTLANDNENTFDAKTRVGSISNTIHATGNDGYAIIISGGGDRYSNYPRFWNNCSITYKLLRNNYGFSKDRIYMYVSDGTSSGIDRADGVSSPLDYDGDGLSDVTGSATYTEIANGINAIASSIQDTEELLVYITSHGDNDENGSRIALWNSNMYDFQLQALLSNVHAKKINIVVSACESGHFIDVFDSPNHTVMTACRSTELAKTLYNDASYSAFPYHWVEAMKGNADVNSDLVVTFAEAYAYVYEKIRENARFFRVDQHVTYNSNPTEYGENNGIFYFDLALNCTQHFYSTSSATINNLQSTDQVHWSKSKRIYMNNSEIVSNTESTSNVLTFSENSIYNVGYYDIEATITKLNGHRCVLNKRVSFGIPSPNVGQMNWHSGTNAGSVGLGRTTSYLEMTVDAPSTIDIDRYEDVAEYSFTNPEIFDIYDVDVNTDDMYGNSATISSATSGMGTLQVKFFDPQNHDSETFEVPYVCYDMSNVRLTCNPSTKRLSISDQKGILKNGIQSVDIYSSPENKVLSFKKGISQINLNTLDKGKYIVKIKSDRDYYYKLVIE